MSVWLNPVMLDNCYFIICNIYVIYMINEVLGHQINHSAGLQKSNIFEITAFIISFIYLNSTHLILAGMNTSIYWKSFIYHYLIYVKFKSGTCKNKEPGCLNNLNVNLFWIIFWYSDIITIIGLQMRLNDRFVKQTGRHK